MNREWFSAKELIAFSGLPSSTQGIHSMARRQNWKRRRRYGTQGRGVEYHKDSIPIATTQKIVLHEPSVDYLYPRHQDPLSIWVESYNQLNEKERKKLITFIVREGMLEVINRININSDYI